MKKYERSWCYADNLKGVVGSRLIETVKCVGRHGVEYITMGHCSGEYTSSRSITSYSHPPLSYTVPVLGANLFYHYKIVAFSSKAAIYSAFIFRALIWVPPKEL